MPNTDTMSITLHIEGDNENYEIIEWRYQVRKDIDSKGRGVLNQ